MRILVLGATGPTGLLLVEQALERGHHVTCVVRDAGLLGRLESDRLDVRVADPVDEDSIEASVAGAEAVLFAVGSRERLAEVHVYSLLTKATLEAMTRNGVSRIICLSAAGVGDTSNPAVPWLFRAIAIPLWARHEYADMERMERLLVGADVDWTSLRPLWLRNGPARGGYRLAAEPFAPRGWGVRRADVATAMLDLAENRAWSRSRVWMAY